MIRQSFPIVNRNLPQKPGFVCIDCPGDLSIFRLTEYIPESIPIRVTNLPFERSYPFRGHCEDPNGCSPLSFEGKPT